MAGAPQAAYMAQVAVQSGVGLPAVATPAQVTDTEVADGLSIQAFAVHSYGVGACSAQAVVDAARRAEPARGLTASPTILGQLQAIEQNISATQASASAAQASTSAAQASASAAQAGTSAAQAGAAAAQPNIPWVQIITQVFSEPAMQGMTQSITQAATQNTIQAAQLSLQSVIQTATQSATQAATQAAMQAIHQALAPAQLGQALQPHLQLFADRLTALPANTRTRAHNKESMSSRGPLQPLHVERGPAPLSVPPAGAFPATTAQLWELDDAQLDTLAAFYTVDFGQQGAMSTGDRRMLFARFVQ